MGQGELCKANRNPIGVESKTSYYKESDYIEADSESHGGEIPYELFCVTGKDSELVDIEDLY